MLRNRAEKHWYRRAFPVKCLLQETWWDSRSAYFHCAFLRTKWVSTLLLEKPLSGTDLRTKLKQERKLSKAITKTFQYNLLILVQHGATSPRKLWLNFRRGERERERWGQQIYSRRWEKEKRGGEGDRDKLTESQCSKVGNEKNLKKAVANPKLCSI